MGEPRRTAPYHDDLRWRIVWQRICDCFTIKQISQNLHIAESTVMRILDRFERTGTVSANKATPRAHCLHQHDELLLLQLINENPSIYLREIRQKLLETTGVNASESTICRSLQRMGFTRKRMQHVALQRSNVLIGEYQADISLFDSNSLVFVDETGSDQRDALRNYGYSLRGYPAHSAKILFKGTRYSAIGVMSTTELLDSFVVEGTVDGDVFYTFVQTSLLPYLQEFNGVNPNSIVVMDNCSIHHLQEVIELIHCVGALVMFLPPYSPHLMPIEYCFSKVKLFLKEHEDVAQAVGDAKLLLRAAFASITPEDCLAWSTFCGYI